MVRIPWMKQLVLVRHGESEFNASGPDILPGMMRRWEGVRQPDIPLTERGRRQALATGKYLRTFRFERAFVSPYLRAIQTAELIFTESAAPPPQRFDERIREKEDGVFEGLTAEGIATKYPEEWARRRREGSYYFRPPGGENHPDVGLRVHSFLTSLRHNFEDQSLLVVCHGAVMWSFRRLLERFGEEDLLALQRESSQEMCNCCVLVYETEAESGRPVLVENRVCYGPDEASTEACRQRSATS
ncbi:MAG: histidine phosphatase family protein [Acidobacteriales bacterium]|nr:histidine phosphatase family protein [Terriglobales bacterium]